MEREYVSQIEESFQQEQRIEKLKTFEDFVQRNPIRLWVRLSGEEAKAAKASDVFVYIDEPIMAFVGIREDSEGSTTPVYFASIEHNHGEGPSFEGNEVSPDGSAAKKIYEKLLKNHNSLGNFVFKALSRFRS